MTRNTKTITPPAILTAVLWLMLGLGILCFGTVSAMAADPTDEIEHFHITVDVQEDASLRMTYQIDWKVLDDERYGPLTWVDIGLPNSHHSGAASRFPLFRTTCTRLTAMSRGRRCLPLPRHGLTGLPSRI